MYDSYKLQGLSALLICVSESIVETELALVEHVAAIKIT